MMTLKTATSIQSLGPPPEKHADRVVAEMLRDIVKARMRMNVDIVKSMRMRGFDDGNPRAQKKFARKLAELGRPFVLEALCETGKRGRYTLSIYHVDGWNPGLKEPIFDEAQMIPIKPWLTVAHHKITSKGRHVYDHDANHLLFMTHHALSRLSQRCGARTPTDLLHAVASIWTASQRELIPGVPGQQQHERLPNGYRLRFPLVADGVNNTNFGVAVFEHYDDGEGGLVVKTILDPIRSDEETLSMET